MDHAKHVLLETVLLYLKNVSLNMFSVLLEKKEMARYLLQSFS